MSKQAQSRATSMARTRQTIRYWRRRERPAAFGLAGWLPILGLLAIFAYGVIDTAPAMQRQIAEQVDGVLSANGLTDFEVVADGQDVLVSGRGSPRDAVQIEAIARTAACDTWIARGLVCPTSVRVELVEPPQAAPSELQAAPQPSPGLSPTPQEDRQAEADFPDPLDRSEPAAALPAPVASAAARCEAELAELLAESTIEFRSGSAEIAPGSRALIAALADVARDCETALSVEGHTDSIGRDDVNRALSLARAEAVVAALIAAGIEPSQLSARGFGASRPIADNATAAGRARNRRIEINSSEDVGESNR